MGRAIAAFGKARKQTVPLGPQAHRFRQRARLAPGHSPEQGTPQAVPTFQPCRHLPRVCSPGDPSPLLPHEIRRPKSCHNRASPPETATCKPKKHDRRRLTGVTGEGGGSRLRAAHQTGAGWLSQTANFFFACFVQMV
jgi:hypothetical protein